MGVGREDVGEEIAQFMLVPFQGLLFAGISCLVLVLDAYMGQLSPIGS